MKAYLLDVVCAECRANLLVIWKHGNAVALSHPPMPAMNPCPNAGKTFKPPVVELEEA